MGVGRRGDADTGLDEYYDEDPYPLRDRGDGTARDLCRCLIKRFGSSES